MAVDFPFADPASEEGRRSLFFGALQRQFGPQLSFGQQRYGADAFRGFENRFLGQGGQQILAGGAPTRTWVDFLNDLNVGREFRRAPTAQTGLGTSRFTSPGRFLLNL